MSSGKRNARVVAARQLSPSVRWLSLELADGPMPFVPGQWINLYIPSPDGLLKRAYSLAGPHQAPWLEIAVTHVPAGQASPILHGLAPGSEIALDGPHGFFVRDEASRAAPNLFVATGTGLSPFRSMLLDAGSRGRQPITLLFGCRTEKDVLWQEELSRLQRECAGFRFEVTLSRPSEAWSGLRGYVQGHVVELARALGGRPHVFICGLSPMVNQVRGLCKTELGLERKQIHSERYD